MARALAAAFFVLAFLAAPFGARAYDASVSIDRLPAEAQQTISVIRAGGPFPYERDGVVFGNRERLLPAKPKGYYREYTVRTPRARDRGARRIVKGAAGELYYTDDHYRSFRRINE